MPHHYRSAIARAAARAAAQIRGPADPPGGPRDDRRGQALGTAFLDVVRAAVVIARELQLDASWVVTVVARAAAESNATYRLPTYAENATARGVYQYNNAAHAETVRPTAGYWWGLGGGGVYAQEIGQVAEVARSFGADWRDDDAGEIVVPLLQYAVIAREMIRRHAPNAGRLWLLLSHWHWSPGHGLRDVVRGRPMTGRRAEWHQARMSQVTAHARESLRALLG